MRLLLLLLALPCTPALRYLVLRHGQTDHNRDGIIQGSSDVSYTSEQSERSGVEWCRVDWSGVEWSGVSE